MASMTFAEIRAHQLNARVDGDTAIDQMLRGWLRPPLRLIRRLAVPIVRVRAGRASRRTARALSAASSSGDTSGPSGSSGPGVEPARPASQFVTASDRSLDGGRS